MAGVSKAIRSRTALESATGAGDSPVCDTACSPDRHLSRAQHVKVGPNPRGPSRKAKYSLATDSEPSSASERWEEPLQGEDSEPETTCLQAVGARLLSSQQSAAAVGSGSRQVAVKTLVFAASCRLPLPTVRLPTADC